MSDKIIDSSNRAHQPVLPKEVIEYLAPQPGQIVIDGTIGLGGHSELFLPKIQPRGRLIGIDLDCQSLAQAQKRLLTCLPAGTANEPIGSLDLFCDNFANIGDIIGKLGLKGVDIILLDLGISSYQLDTPARGFSFMNDAPLDMRMSPNNPFSASIVVNDYPEDELIRIFRSYGEERFAKRIAQRIVSSRAKEQIQTTGQLVAIIKKAAPSGWQRIHPATRVFQALRIEVNKELANLEGFLAGFTQWLNPNGRAGIISFHSLEDRLVKRSFRKYKEEGGLEIITKKPVTPTAEEEKQNPRSRSAKFRVALKK